ncbi:MULTISPECIES: GNAT family N-acetyltransferase [Dyadobacter]|uniref:GNAT family N-acetyltransferase n=1 Tax=Dyadobacter TaxID=120831 RepID=UPI0038D3A015
MHCLYIKSEFHKAGIGKALMQVCLDQVGQPATLKCIIANTDAIAFYQKRGWQIAGTGDNAEGPYALMGLGKKTVQR